MKIDMKQSIMKQTLILITILSLFTLGCSPKLTAPTKAPASTETSLQSPKNALEPEPKDNTDAPERPFIVRVETIKPNSDVTIQVTQPDEKHHVLISYNVDCGDGSEILHDQKGDIHCIYKEPNSYNISISGNLIGINLIENDPFRGKDYYFTDIIQWGSIEWHDFTKFAERCPKLTLSAQDAPNLKHVESLDLMFFSTSINSPINHWDVSNIKSMYGTFLYSPFNHSLENWDVSNVQDMSYMFSGSDFNQPLNKWNVSNVKTMYSMFRDAEHFNQPLDHWNVKNVESMECMFWGAKAFKQNISQWDFSGIDKCLQKHGKSSPDNDYDPDRIGCINYIFSYDEKDYSNFQRYNYLYERFPSETIVYDHDNPDPCICP